MNSDRRRRRRGLLSTDVGFGGVVGGQLERMSGSEGRERRKHDQKKVFPSNREGGGFMGEWKKGEGIVWAILRQKKSMEKLFVQYDSGQLPSEKRTFPR